MDPGITSGWQTVTTQMSQLSLCFTATGLHQHKLRGQGQGCGHNGKDAAKRRPPNSSSCVLQFPLAFFSFKNLITWEQCFAFFTICSRICTRKFVFSLSAIFLDKVDWVIFSHLLDIVFKFFFQCITTKGRNKRTKVEDLLLSVLSAI